MNTKQSSVISFSNKFRTLRKISDALHLGTSSTKTHRLGVLGVALGKGQKSNAGVELGPEAIRSTNFIRTLEEELGYIVNDYGDIRALITPTDTLINNVWNTKFIGHVCERVSSKVQDIIRNGDPVLTLGGDHSVTIGSINGHALVQPDMCLINVGAHADINTITTSKTSYMNGMANSFHVYELEAYNNQVALPGLEWLKPTVRARDVVFVGLRDVDPLERLIFDKCGIRFFSMHDVDRLGIIEVTKRALDAVNSRRNRPIHISFDIDAYDINVAPSTAIGFPGGLTLREGLTFAEEIANTGLLTGLDIVEVNTKVGLNLDKEKTLCAVRETILAFCGNCRGGNLPIDIKTIPFEQQPPKLSLT